MHSIAQLPTFTRQAEQLLDQSTLDALISYLAEHPTDGDIMAGTGGVRKLRWRRDSHGKSGGVRVIYYYHDDHMPLYLLTLFAKNAKSNLSKAERNELAGLVVALVGIWKGKRS